ncbi:MAG: MerC domain-containing protein [Bacteroidota bacterium]
MLNWMRHINWDWLGFSASLACALHCALLPVLLTLSAFGSLYFLEAPIFEYSFIVLSFGIASFSLVQGYRKHHQRWDALSIAALGFICILLGQFSEGNMWEAIFSAIGGSMVAIAHLINLRLSRLQLCRV